MFIECTDRQCPELLNHHDIKQLVSSRTFNLYQKLFYRQFVTDHASMTPCPAPGCERVIRLLTSIPTPTPTLKPTPISNANSSQASLAAAPPLLMPPEDHSVPVKCACGLLFCFLCKDAEIGDHTPATCQQVRSWMEKVSSEAENVTWIIANTKKCPKCRAPIEKNGGCMHMTCSPAHGGCGHQWCWLCWGPWSEHGTSTGGFYHCNKYDSSAAKAHDQRTSDVKTDLETYMFYFHRYDSHRVAGRVASAQMNTAENTGFYFQEIFSNLRAADTKFLLEATQQLFQNRRVLQFSYVYGYYLRINSAPGSAERNLFEYLQENLEMYTNELSNTFEAWQTIASYEDFVTWKENVANYTRVTSKFLHNFISGIQAGLTNPAL
jgi:ariadne-1